MATGVDLIGNAVNAALGDAVEEMQDPQYDGYWAEYILHAPCDGVFDGIDILEDFQRKYVVEMDPWVAPGARVLSFTSASASLGTVVMRFGSRACLERGMMDIRRSIHVKVR